MLPEGGNTILDKPVDRRGALGMILGALAAGTQAASACSPASLRSEEEREAKLLEWEEYFKGNFRLMTEEEKAETIARLERLAELRQGVDVSIRGDGPIPGVVYGYAFNISKCNGFRNCVEACIEENNLDRETGTQYIRIFEMEDGESIDDLEHADATFGHSVPAEGHFYLGTQCFQCANPPCVTVCPVQATWQEPDGIVVVDYDWCIGCRYCMAACPLLGAPLQLVRARGARRGAESPAALPGQPGPQEGVRGEVHLLHPAHPGGPPAGVRRGVPHGRPGLRQPPRSGLGDPVGPGEQERLPPEGRAGDRAPLLVLHGLIREHAWSTDPRAARHSGT